MGDAELSPGEIALLIDGLGDEVSLNWALIDLGIMANPPLPPSWTPTSVDLDEAFASFRRLVDGGFALIGRMQPCDAGTPNPVAPMEHVSEDLPEVRRRVEAAVANSSRPTDWAFACWLVNTPRGDLAAKEALGEE